MSSEAKNPVTLACCDTAKKWRTVYLEIPDSFFSGDLDTPPTWVVRGYHPEYESIPAPTGAAFCPHCGRPAPGIVPSGDRRKICKVTDGGYYCDTCGKRLIQCGCGHPTRRWKCDKPKEKQP